LTSAEWGSRMADNSSAPVTHAVPAASSRVKSTQRGRFIASLVGFAFLATVAAAGVSRYYLLSSEQAVVAGRIVVLRAPIDGVVARGNPRAGDRVDAGQEILRMTNPWQDTQNLSRLESELEMQDARLAALQGLLDDIERFRSGLVANASAYERGRSQILNSLLQEADARVEAERARAEEAKGKFERGQKLLEQGLTSTQELAIVERDYTVANAALAQAVSSLEAAKRSSLAARDGVQLDPSGSVSDRPYNRQRADDLRIDAARIRDQYRATSSARESVEAQIRAERARLERMNSATLLSPVRGRIWRLSSRETEYAEKGQKLLEILDCNSLQVVALVTPRLFNKLHLRGKVEFKFTGERQRFVGVITQLLASTTTDTKTDNLVAPGIFDQIMPLERERLLSVVITLPELPKAVDCQLGFTGEVRFR
jgi:multidrug resistance efflux pump